VTADGTVVTPVAVYPYDAAGSVGAATGLHSLRWKPPSFANVSAGGFIAPLDHPVLVDGQGKNVLMGGCTIH
jgi:hypothetical protein